MPGGEQSTSARDRLLQARWDMERGKAFDRQAIHNLLTDALREMDSLRDRLASANDALNNCTSALRGSYDARQD